MKLIDSVLLRKQIDALQIAKAKGNILQNNYFTGFAHAIDGLFFDTSGKHFRSEFLDVISVKDIDWIKKH